jgi:S1-C subfamily serine protease
MAAAATVALLATAFLGVGTAQAAPGVIGRPPVNAIERAATLTRPAVVRLTMAYSVVVVDGKGTALNGGKPFEGGGTCTGFGVNPAGYVATAGHCVDLTDLAGIGGALLSQVAQQLMTADPTLTVDAVLAKAPTWTLRGPTPGSEPFVRVEVIIGADGSAGAPRRYPAEIKGSRPIAKGDAALLKIDLADLPTLPLAADADVRVGQDVLLVGFPGSADELVDASLEPSFKDGRISSKKTAAGVPFYETGAALAHGMSGGPAVDVDGRVVGVNSWSPTGETSAINFLATSSTMAEFLSAQGVRPERGRVDTMFGAAYESYTAGRYTAAIAELDRLLAVAPAHPQAAQLRLAAFDGRERYGEVVPPAAPKLLFGMAPAAFWSLVGGGGVLLFGLLGLVIARLSRQERDGAQVPCPRCAAARRPGAGYCTTCGLPQPA